MKDSHVLHEHLGDGDRRRCRTMVRSDKVKDTNSQDATKEIGRTERRIYSQNATEKRSDYLQDTHAAQNATGASERESGFQLQELRGTDEIIEAKEQHNGYSRMTNDKPTRTFRTISHRSIARATIGVEDLQCRGER